MARIPDSVKTFLDCRHIAVAGVSRSGKEAGNAIFRRLKASGHTVYPLNPRTAEVEGVECYPDLSAVPGPVEGLVIASPPDSGIQLVEACGGKGVEQVWFHRSFGQGSVSDDAVTACENQGIGCIVGGCPLMFCEPVDLAHKCMRWFLQRKGRVPR